MKTIEEKARAYDEAFEKLRNFYRDYDTVSHLIDVKEELANLFPELVESEDEKIRKELMEFLVRKRIISNDLEGINIDKTLAWLEKQGEHKKFRDSIQVGDEVTRNSDGVIVNMSQLNRVAKKDEKQSETFTKKDVDNAYVEGMAFAKNELEKQGEQKSVGEEIVEALRTEYEKGRADAFAEMQKEWSEEDEELLNIIIDNIKGYDAYTGCIALKFGLHENKINWLKFIKNRVQSKQEWSKEDNGVLFEIISVLQNSSHWVLADKLKSIILQNHWKPNDTQMDALNDVISSRDIKYDVLSELWKDLKKLKDNS